MSLRWRIVGAFALIILITVSFSFWSNYQTTQQRLETFRTQINRNTADTLSVNLSKRYVENGWDAVPVTVMESGFTPGDFNWIASEMDARAAESGSIFGSLEWVPTDLDTKAVERSGESSARRRLRAVRIVVVDIDDRVVVDSFSHLSPGAVVPPIDAEFATIVDGTHQPVGGVYFDVNRNFLVDEANDFLLNTFYTTALGALVTIVTALLLAVWLSRRIVAPVTALTEATQAIAEQKDAQLLPVKSDDELGRMSASFNQMTTALKVQRDLRSRLIDDVAHELNTPLSVILLEAKGLQDEIQAPGDAAEQIIDEVDKLRDLVHDLNWLAETDVGQLKLNKERCSMNHMLEAAIERWRLHAQVAKVDLQLTPLPDDVVGVPMDAARIAQAVGNLIQNSLQHTESGGRITISCTLEGDQIKTAVRDTGIGISAEDLPYVFERFYRADPSRQRATGGRGLGLAIVKRIIQAHGGRVWVESTRDVGSVFYFSLPNSTS